MAIRITIVSVGHAIACLMAFVSFSYFIERIRAGDTGITLVAVALALTIVLGLRLQFAVVLTGVAKLLNLLSPRLGACCATFAIRVAPARFKVALAAAVGIASAATTPALASPMWPTTQLEAPTVSTPASALPSPGWPVTDEPATLGTDEPVTNIYTVKPGDSLSSIGAQHGVSAQALYSANTRVIGANPNLIYPGQTLEMP